jgi:hypothetical protein
MENGSWFLVLGSWFLVLGSWFLVLGSWFLAALTAARRSRLKSELVSKL